MLQTVIRCWVKLGVLIVVLSGFILSVSAEEAVSAYPTPVGYFLVMTKDNAYPRSVVQLKVINGQLQGYFDTFFYVPGRAWASTCEGCLAPYTGQKLEGLHFMMNLKPKSNQWDAVWGPGSVFNADTNKMYSIKVQQVDNGLRLKMIGCLPNASFLCRTSYWTRITSTKQLAAYRKKGVADQKNHAPTAG